MVQHRFHEPFETEEPEISVTAVSRPMPVIPTGDDALRGEWFGDYLLVGELAVGGMAEVFLAVKEGIAGFRKVVVIKRVLPQFCANPEFVRMFVDEARLAARLEHPNIVRTHEFGEVDGQYFSVMEYLPGEDLSKVIERLGVSRQRMPLHVAAGIATKVLAGLELAHELTDTSGRPLDLVHRDIAPGNIIVTYGGEVKVIDFGVAKTNTSDTIAGTIKGKIAYMSPEQVLGRGVDRRSDVFSVGIVLWEMLTGRPLFMRNSEAATLYAVMEDPIPPPSRFRSDLPRQVDAIVMRALARTASDRYRSAAEMGAALEDLLGNLPRCDARVLADLIEDLFGSTRAHAKRSIAQTRSLATNISLVMKLRSDIRSGLANVDAIQQAERAAAARPQRGFVIALVTLLVAVVAAALVYMFALSPATERPAPAVTVAARPTLEVTSTPSGAAVFVGGEPTGLTTPTTLQLETAGQVAIRIELPGHEAQTETVQLAAGAALRKQFTLVASESRLVISGLPSDATLIVDGEEYVAGVVIPVPAGEHDVRVLVNGKVVARQSIRTGAGISAWQLAGGTLTPNQP